MSHLIPRFMMLRCVLLALILVLMTGCGGGGGDNGGQNPILPASVPDPPENLRATAISPNEIELSWVDASENEDAFKVYRHATIWTDRIYVTTIIANTQNVTITGLNPGTIYTFDVTAYNKSGESIPSNTASATTLATSTPKPASPTGLIAVPFNSGRIDLSWNDNADDEDRYRVYRYVSASNINNLFVNLPANTVSYSDNSVVSGTEYYYLVKAYNEGGESEASNAASVTTYSPEGIWDLTIFGSAPPCSTNIQILTEASITEVSLNHLVVATPYGTLSGVYQLDRDAQYVVQLSGGFNVPGYGSIIISPLVIVASLDWLEMTNGSGAITYSSCMGSITSADFIAIALGSPDPPSNLQSIALSATTIRLSWTDNSDDETGFKLYRSDTLNGTYEEIATFGIGGNSYLDSDLNPDDYYFYRVQAFNTSGYSGFSNPSSARTFPAPSAPPTAPSGVVATLTSPTQIQLTWQDNSNDEDGFNILRCTQSNIGWYCPVFPLVTASLGPDATIFYDHGITSGKTYKYSVSAYNMAGISNPSNEALVTVPPLEIPPDAPSQLRAAAQSNSQIRLDWSDNSTNEDLFRIYRGLTSITMSLVNTVGENTTTYTDNGLSSGTTYFYRVTAYNTHGESGATQASATTQGGSTGVLNPPTNLNASAISDTEILLGWQDNSENESGFKVYYRCCGANYVFHRALRPNTTQTSVSELTADTQYDFYMVAYNANGESVASNIATVRTLLSNSGGPGAEIFVAQYDAVIAQDPYTPNVANTSYPNDINGNAVGNTLNNIYFDGLPIGCGVWRSQTLVKFNIDSVISGKTINKALLRLYPFSLPGDFAYNYDYWACGTNYWPPYTATFNNNSTYIPGTCDQVNRPENTLYPMEWDLTVLVRKWASGDLPNYGIIIWEPDTACVDYYDAIRVTNFESLEVYNSGDRRPQLYIEWE